MKNKITGKSIFYLVLFILSIIGFFLTAFVGLVMCLLPQWLFVILAVIPIAVFGAMFINSRKGKLQSPWAMVITCFLAVIFLVGGVINGGFMIFNDSLTETTEIKYYKRIINSYGYPDSKIYFFPKKVPKNALTSEFYYSPQFLQGGSNLYLALKYNKEDYDLVVNDLKDKAEEIIYEGGRTLKPHNEYVRGDYYITEGFINRYAPDTYRTDWTYYIFENHKGTEDWWNHGKIAGVAVNEKNNIIVYYRENW